MALVSVTKVWLVVPTWDDAPAWCVSVNVFSGGWGRLLEVGRDMVNLRHTEDAAHEYKERISTIACLPGLQHLCRKTHDGLRESQTDWGPSTIF